MKIVHLDFEGTVKSQIVLHIQRIRIKSVPTLVVINDCNRDLYFVK